MKGARIRRIRIVGVTVPWVVAIMALALLLGAGTAAWSEDGFAVARARMLERDIAGRGVSDERVLRAMGKVPRHLFVDPDVRNRAYEDYPLPIGEGQTISQPYVVALMTEALQLREEDRVLEIGTGSGYQAAVLAEIVREVFTVEIRPDLARQAAENLRNSGYDQVHVRTGDGYFGWEDHAPFDAIIVTAAANHVAPPLIKQLKTGGRLIIPLGRTTFYQYLTLLEKEGASVRSTQLGGVAFVPMIGEVGKSNAPSDAPR